jgi:PKD repeat protein
MQNVKRLGQLAWRRALQWTLMGACVAVLVACGAAQETANLPVPVVTPPVVEPPVTNQTPTSSFTATANGLTVTFDASASRDAEGPLSSYRWVFGDGTPAQSAASATITHVYSASGTYVVNLVVLDANGSASAVFSQNVTAVAPLANQAPTAGFAAAANGLSAGVDASLSTDPDGTVTTYAWTFGEPGSTSNTATGKTATHTYAATGTYTVTLVVTDNAGLTATSQQQVNIVGSPNANPVANFTSTRDALLVNFNAQRSTDSDGTITTYAWNFGESKSPTNTATGVTATHAFKFAGSYTVTLVVTDDKGATGNQQSLVVVIPPAAIITGQLNDTGVIGSACYQAGSDVQASCTSTAAIALNADQDGMIGRDAFSSTNSNADGALGFSFTKIGASGETLPANAPQWNCVKDNVTGLMWEVKNGIAGDLHNRSATFTNYDSTSAAQLATGGIPTQADIDAATNSIGFRNAVNTAGWCGATDWRLPDPSELQSYIDFGSATSGGFVEGTVANNAATSYITSSGSRAGAADHWIFRNQGDALASRATPAAVQLVRGSPTNTAAARYEILAATPDVVYDTKTGLEWRRCVEGTSLTTSTSGALECSGNPTALTQEAALALARTQGGQGWRLPNIKEAFSIIDRTAANSVIDAVAFPNTPVGGTTDFLALYLQWTSTSNYVTPYSLAFGLGVTNRSAGATVRLVRTPNF